MAESSELADMGHVAKIRMWFSVIKVWAFPMYLGFAAAFRWNSYSEH